MNRRKATRAPLRRLVEWTNRFREMKVLVVGDLIVDEFIWGRVNRISPEAPVPIVHVTDRSLRMGGAANVVHNLRVLGAKVLVSGVVGEDEPGRWLVGEMKRKGIPIGGIVQDRGRHSSLKTRIIAHGQQVVRIDQEEAVPIASSQMEMICSYVANRATQVDGIIVSDYGKGVVGEPLMETVRGLARDLDLVVAVDPKESRFPLYRDVTVVTPNHREAAQAVGMQITSDERLVAAGRELMSELGCRILLITRGEEGMSLFLDDDKVVHIPTVAREVFDVTGAGDTVISAFTLGLCAGSTPEEAATIANVAAGMVVGEVGTAVVSNRRLQRAFREMDRIR